MTTEPGAGRREALLLSPAALVYGALLVAPLLFLFRTSLLPPGPGAPLTGPLGLDAYRKLADGYYVIILWRTLRIAGLTTLGCLVLGYPLALSLTRSRGRARTVKLLLIVSPLFVSVVVRSYGWVLLLGNRGVVNGLLSRLGIIDDPIRFLYTEAAVVIALVESLLPFMALSIAAVLDRLGSDVHEAARGLGASPLQVFWHVSLPLSIPGAVSGALLVFMVSLGSYATPALLGGSRIRVLVTEIYTQATSVFDWPLAAALSFVLLFVALSLASMGRRRSA